MMEDFCVLLFIAGLDTVINGMGFGIHHLAQDQAMQARLRAEPALIGEAMEEFLRRYTFVSSQRRMAKDAMIAGQTLKEGDSVILFWPAADLDPRRFVQPELCDVDREDKAHAAFGAGPHRCLGSHLARIELQIVYEQMLSRLPTFRLDPDKPATFRTGNIIAVETLSLLWG
jgi:cytochrome P450